MANKHSTQLMSADDMIKKLESLNNKVIQSDDFDDFERNLCLVACTLTANFCNEDTSDFMQVYNNILIDTARRGGYDVGDLPANGEPINLN